MKELLTVAFCLAIVAFGISVVVKDNSDFQKFVAEHNCKIVGKVRGGVATGIGSNGTVTTFIEDDKTGWLCDDGVTYWR